ncbi:hypothetical protein ACIBG0_20220 [Nocardia sp. NPDC050630]|uniref:hypothetical protein n=1 Tax=Nocardia sp. NPDC050630 TaxID=3364321 RepID=UPI0037A2D78C
MEGYEAARSNLRAAAYVAEELWFRSRDGHDVTMAWPEGDLYGEEPADAAALLTHAMPTVSQIRFAHAECAVLFSLRIGHFGVLLIVCR